MDKFVKVTDSNAVSASTFAEYFKENLDSLHEHVVSFAKAIEQVKEQYDKEEQLDLASNISAVLVSLNYFNYASQNITKQTQELLKNSFAKYAEFSKEMTNARREVSEVDSKKN